MTTNPVVELPFLCNAACEHVRFYRLRAEIAGDAPLVEVDGRWLRPHRLAADWTFELGPGWHLAVVQVDGPAIDGPPAAGEVLTRWWICPADTVPGWLARLLEREHPAGLVGS